MMHTCKRVLSLVLALMLLPLCPALADGGSFSAYTLGSQVQDFTVTTYDGQTFTLSEALKEKELVLLNIWASWCGPCEMEFPYLQEAFEAYAEDVAVVAVSCEANDTDDVLRAYATERGLTFPIARDTANLASLFQASSIPTSAVIDRFGNVAFLHSGAITSTEEFTRLFDAFMGETYTATRPLLAIPAMRPNIPKAEVARLSEALNPALSFQNPADVYIWPMIPAEVDDRLCLMSTNGGMHGMQSSVSAQISAKAGDAIAVTFRLSSETTRDFFRIVINGETVKVFSGERDFMTYAWPVPADGLYTLSLVYEKDDQISMGDDLVYIDEVALLSGAAADAALAANPVYPTGDATMLTVASDGAQEIVFDDPTFSMLYFFGLARYYIVPTGNVELHATLADDVDPEAAFFMTDEGVTGLVDAMEADGYRLTLPIESSNVTGYLYSTVALVPNENSLISEIDPVVFFTSVEDVEMLLQMLALYGMQVNGWSYAVTPNTAAEVLTPAIARYTLILRDQDGTPVVGAIANFCDADTCTTLVSDAEGRIVFEKAPYAYDVHIIKVPDGYTFDTAAAIEVPLNGGEVELLVQKN